MKILIDLTSLADNFSGIERFALCITQCMINAQEHEYILIFKNEVHKAFLNENANVKKIILKGKNKLFFNQVTLPLNLWRIKADCYLFLAFPAPFLFFSKNAISAIHDMGCWDCPETNKSSMMAYFRILYRKATMCEKKIITVSQFSKKRIMDVLHVKPQNIAVIYDGISECFLNFVYDPEKNAQIQERLGLPEHYILCLSTLEPRKNMRFLIEAYGKIRYNQNVNYELVLVGRKGWMVDSLLNGIPEDIKKHIHITGFVGDEELPYVYRGAELFVFPSIYEGFGIPPVEAIACGTKVLSSDAAAMPEILGDAAEFFHSGDMSDLMQKMENMLQKKEKIHKYTREYSWDKESKKLLYWIEKNKNGKGNK